MQIVEQMETDKSLIELILVPSLLRAFCYKEHKIGWFTITKKQKNYNGQSREE